MFDNIICPISTERVDSNVSRLTVFLQVIVLAYFLFTLQPIPLYLVTIDCSLRAMGQNRYSLLCLLASLLIKVLGITPKMTAKAPKEFASRLGFLCGLLGSIFIPLQMPTSSIVIIGMWTILAILDSVFNFCVGCLIYNYIVYPFYKKR
jgi:Domain of unknown function (DUF4395)